MVYPRLIGFILFALLMIQSTAGIGRAEEQAALQADPAQLVQVELTNIRHTVQARLASPAPALYRRHLESILALCDDAVLTSQVAGPKYSDEQELLGYLRAIDTGLTQSAAQQPATYLENGTGELDFARLSRLDRTIQFYAVRLPPRWDPHKAYPLWVQLHGRWSNLPLALVANSFLPNSGSLPTDAIVLTPWVRGNSDYRLAYGSEPDVWEAIDDLKSYATLDSQRWYISGHSWGGDDVWSIVLRTPDLWAAAGIMAGSPVSVPDQLGLVANARYVPFYLWRGSADPVPDRKEAFGYFRDALTRVGDPPQMVVADGVPHMYRPQDIDAMAKWLFQHVRQRPNKFSFVVDTREHRGVWGVTVPIRYEGAYFEVEPRAGFQCEISGSIVQIETTNTNRLDVDLGPRGLQMSGSVKLLVNGRESFEGPVPAKPLTLSW